MVDHDEDTPDEDAPGQGARDGERVAKALARAGVASRREVERYIAEGRVALNGRVLESPGVKVAPGDILTVDGAAVDAAEPTRLFRYHKPVGLLTTNSDPAGRPTVFQHLPPELPRLISIGRLDINTEGLLLLTNDGELARALELPSKAWVRRYRARCYGKTDQNKLDSLKAGITVEGVAYGPIEARLDKAQGAEGANLWISVAITEGKNREVRRVLEHLGLKVNRLIRLAYGPFALSTLEAGQVEEVGPRVIREQLLGVVSPAYMPTGERPQYRTKPSPAAKAARRAGVSDDGGGAVRRLEESGRAVRPEKPVYKPGWARPAKREGPVHTPPKAKPKTWAAGPRREGDAGPKPYTSRDARPSGPRPGAPDERPRAATPARFSTRPAQARSGEDRPRGEDRPFKPRAPAENAGRSPRGPSGPRTEGAKFGPRPPKPPAGAKAPPKKTGLELAPPMRHSPRRGGPKRPPRKD